MRVISKRSNAILALAMIAAPASVGFAQQSQDQPVTVDGRRLPDGPEIKGFISARNDDKVQVTATDGTNTVVAVTDQTKISASGGFLGLGGNKLAANQLLNGIPVSIKTLQAPEGLIAGQIKLQNKDLKTAQMIRNGTDQRFAEQTAATEALRSRVGDIDQYNVKSTTNVNFATGKAALTAEAKNNLCAAATEAQGLDNALILVVGYTDSTGSQELNQVLSEKRASSVINYLQQACGWKPYRMLTPTGMAEADPLADNTTSEGKAQNRRVAVNVLVSKAVDGI